MSNITPKQLEKIAAGLKSLREELQLEEDSEREELSEEIPSDSADAAPVRTRLGITLKEYENRHEQLIAIDEALARIADNSFGLCIECEEAISWPRLQVIPYARYCVSCQTEREELKKIK
jgi:DnaK suppressor protein